MHNFSHMWSDNFPFGVRASSRAINCLRVSLTRARNLCMKLKSRHVKVKHHVKENKQTRSIAWWVRSKAANFPIDLNDETRKQSEKGTGKYRITGRKWGCRKARIEDRCFMGLQWWGSFGGCVTVFWWIFEYWRCSRQHFSEHFGEIWCKFHLFRNRNDQKLWTPLLKWKKFLAIF